VAADFPCKPLRVHHCGTMFRTADLRRCEQLSPGTEGACGPLQFSHLSFSTGLVALRAKHLACTPSTAQRGPRSRKSETTFHLRVNTWRIRSLSLRYKRPAGRESQRSTVTVRGSAVFRRCVVLIVRRVDRQVGNAESQQLALPEPEIVGLRRAWREDIGRCISQQSRGTALLQNPAAVWIRAAGRSRVFAATRGGVSFECRENADCMTDSSRLDRSVASSLPFPMFHVIADYGARTALAFIVRKNPRKCFQQPSGPLDTPAGLAHAIAKRSSWIP